MAFLGLTDLKFTSPQKRKDNKVDSTLKYPLNLGSAERGHYVVFHVNEYGEPTGDTETTAQKNAKMYASGNKNNMNVTTNIGSAAKTLSDKYAPKISERISQNQTANDVVNQVGNASKKILNPSQRYKRTPVSIALYMPNTLQFDYRQQYNSVNATQALGKVGFAVQAGSTLMETGVNGNTIGNMRSFLGELGIGVLKQTGIVGDEAGKMALQAAFDTAVNPQVELLYSHPELRQFDFNFTFYPESVNEALEIDQIINMFKYHAAPEIKANSSGRYFTPPGSFDIEFMYNGGSNKNIPKISTCILENIQVNYAPNGFSAFEVNPSEAGVGEKGDGMPTEVSLTLQFRETEIVTKDLLDQNMSNDGNTF